jgi:hypothetical protein
MSSWEKQVRKYVWDPQKTPFLVPVARLNKGQGASEIFVFVVFLVTPFTLILLAALAYLWHTGAAQYGAMALFAASILAAAVLLHQRKHWLAAAYCLAAPVTLLGYFMFVGFSDRLGLLDKVLVFAMLLGWVWYTLRIVAIARGYADMPPGPPPSKVPRKFR